MVEPSCIVVAGPTGSGKSALATTLAQAFSGTVVNADSMQIYREARVLTARPSPADEARIPHRLFGVLAASDPCSAGRWRTMAEVELAAAVAAKRLPIVVGGTGLYLEALLKGGLAPVPPVPGEVRREAERLHAELGSERFREMLVARDPVSVKLPAGDRQRLLRAWEVLAATGTPLAEWQNRQEQRRSMPAATVILLSPPRERLYSALEARFERMLADGGLEEARALHALALDPALPLMRAVGIRELLDHLAGRMTLEQAVAAAKQGTRRYAKRQMTWFRHRLPADLRIDEQFLESLQPEIFSFIRRRLLTRPS